MAYSGRYQVKNIQKYAGDHQKVVYRSLWERAAFKWLDLNPDVVAWNSEEIVVPYVCKTDGKRHRYFVDLAIEFKNGKQVLVEIKPKAQTRPPKPLNENVTGKRRNKYIKEVLTYVKNQSKWEAANKFAQSNGAVFQIWDETVLEKIGIRTGSNGKKT